MCSPTNSRTRLNLDALVSTGVMLKLRFARANPVTVSNGSLSCSTDTMSLRTTGVAVAVNATCRMSGKAINAKITAKHKGDVVAFCGAGCQKKFTADPVALFKQVKFARKTVNDKCPLSGKAIDPKKTYSVAFCCNNCAGKFKNAPAKSIAKVK